MGFPIFFFNRQTIYHRDVFIGKKKRKRKLKIKNRKFLTVKKPHSKIVISQLPISDPHWLAGTIKRIGICVLPPPPEVPFSLNCEHH